MLSLRTAERFLLSCLDREDAQAAMLPNILSEIVASHRRLKWNLTFQVKHKHLTGNEARTILENTARDTESVSLEMLSEVKEVLLSYLYAKRVDAQLIAKLNKYHQSSEIRDFSELNNNFISARPPEYR